MPKANIKSASADEEDPQWYINPSEAKAHIKALENIMALIKAKIKKQETTDLLENVLSKMKEVLANLNPAMQLADTSTVAHDIHDKNFNVLLPRSDTVDQLLQEILPDEDLPDASVVLREAQMKHDISENDREIVAELFSNLEVAHDHIATACGLLSRLSRTLKSDKLLTIIKASIRPLIQLNRLETLERETAKETPWELPDKQQERVRILSTPDPWATLLQREKPNSTTRLLAATYTYKILNTFGPGTTQRGLQEIYQVKAKQLAACITGHKYLGGADCKTKSSGSDEGASSSKKPTGSQ